MKPEDRWTWDVAVRRRLGRGAGSFELDVAFRSRARRVVLFGPSGAGKTLTLKAMAGLQPADSGHVRIAERTLLDSAAGIDLPSRDRAVAYLFQEYALFPHLTVAQNLAFGLGRGWRNPSRRALPPQATRWLEAFGLQGLADRYPQELSGGQRQRVALARALVPEPHALLLDEPFAALDAPLRQRLREELGELQRSLELPLLLITHDPADVEALADEVVRIDGGRVVPGAQ